LLQREILLQEKESKSVVSDFVYHKL